MQVYDVCLAWNWVGDADYVMFFEEACRRQNLSLLLVTPVNLSSVMQDLVNGQTTFRVFLDRASDSDPGFNPLVKWARNQPVYHIDPFELASRTHDKALMHFELIRAGVYTPYTIVLPSYVEQQNPQPVDLSPLGKSFAIKPAHGFGGDGVVVDATTWEQVLVARQQYPDDRYLLQAQINPIVLDSKPAWFRVIYCTGQIYPSWWDPKTRIYTPLSSAEENRYSLFPLRIIVATLARVCGLALFSTEVAHTAEGLFVVVDYINDQIDLRIKSKAVDGVPDDIVRDVADRLVALAQAHCRPPQAGI